MEGQYSLVKDGKPVVFACGSLPHLLDTHARRFPDKDAIVYLDDTKKNIFSYKQLREIVGKTAAYLKNKLGLETGERIAFIMKNSPEVLFLNLACWSTSLVSVPLDSKRDALETMMYKIRQTESKVVFVKNDALDEKQKDALREMLHGIKFISFNEINDFLALIEHEKPVELGNSAEQDALVLYTSGTTALPRGALLTVENLVSNADSIADWLSITEKDRFLTVLPLHHINSTTFTLATLLRGGTIILVPRYSNSGFFQQLAESQATITSIVPTICHDQISQEERFNAVKGKLKVTRIQIGSAPVQPQEAEEFVRKFRIPLVQGYGQTETSLRSTGVPYTSSNALDERYFELLKSNTIGTEMKWTNMAVLIDGKEAQEGEIGEICVRGPGIMKGYLGDEEETKKAFEYGWFHSGDMGYYKIVDGRKLFFLVGRIKEIIIKGGINVSPLAVEHALQRAYPEIDQVYVVGYEDARIGEEIGAVIVFKDEVGKEKRGMIIQGITRDGQQGKIHGLSAYESPMKIVEISAEQLPMTSTGKVQRTKIKEMFPRLMQPASIARTDSYIFRQIFPSERDVIKKAVEINNKRWHPLLATEQEFIARSRNGILVGAFDNSGNLLGTVSALRIDNAEELYTTWDKLTGNGTLSTHKANGKILVCVAISTAAKETVQETSSDETLLKEAAPKYVEEYLKSDLDPIVRFHRKPKGGLPGAKLIKVIKDGRVQDAGALGYTIIFEYPEITEEISFTKNASVGVQLIEACMMLAQQLGITKVYAFSRPAGFRKYVAEKIKKALS
ncbi:acyl--CoA ligase [Candidatus Woesearchaeota archaeon]|nr:acyl--CoA ligase [Candidatus Woesearchaeota archaeon]